MPDRDPLLSRDYNPELCRSLHKSLNDKIDGSIADIKDKIAATKEVILGAATGRSELLNQAHQMHVTSMMEALNSIRDNFTKIDEAAEEQDAEVRRFMQQQLAPLRTSVAALQKQVRDLSTAVGGFKEFKDKLVGAYIFAMILYPALTGLVLWLFKWFTNHSPHAGG